MMSIVITGANGEFGRAVLNAVTELRPGDRIVASVRDVARAADLKERGFDVRPGSFDEPDELLAAFRGADTVFINATFFGVATELRGARVARAIGAAAEAGASRIIVTTWPNLDRATLPDVQDYGQSERLVREAAPSWTILRLAYGLADAVARDVIWARRDGELVAPAGPARCVPAAVSDLAGAAAVTVTGAGHENTTYELTGPRAIDWSDLAALAGSIDGRSIRYRSVDDDQYREYLAARGLSSRVADGLLGLYAEFRSGWAATPSPDLGRLLGRAPVDTLDAVSQRVSRWDGDDRL
jgi:NAD(P)H dehydrogenase (quinone)